MGKNQNLGFINFQQVNQNVNKFIILFFQLMPYLNILMVVLLLTIRELIIVFQK